jgi:hypothetical protein
MEQAQMVDCALMAKKSFYPIVIEALLFYRGNIDEPEMGVAQYEL